MSWSNGPTSGSIPTHRAPSAIAWVATTTDGAWYWDGTAWRRTVPCPWPEPPGHLSMVSSSPPPSHTHAPARRQVSTRAHPALWLLLPFAFLFGVVVEILYRALARAVGVVVSIFALGATVAMVGYLFTH